MGQMELGPLAITILLVAQIQGSVGGLGEHILDNEVLEDDENTLVVKKLASLIRPRFGKRGLPPMKSITEKGPLSKVLAYVAENLNRNYFWVNRAYKMSRLNSDNKLKFGKRKRNTALSPLNFTKQKVLMPDVLNEASQLLDSGLAEQIMADAEDEDMGDRSGRGLPYKPLFFSRMATLLDNNSRKESRFWSKL